MNMNPLTDDYAFLGYGAAGTNSAEYYHMTEFNHILRDDVLYEHSEKNGVSLIKRKSDNQMYRWRLRSGSELMAVVQPYKETL